MSIRTYLIVSLASLVLLISAFLSFQSAKIFIGEFQMAREDIMLQLGDEYPEKGLVEQRVLHYHITSDWNKVPPQIKKYFPIPPLEVETLHTRFIDWNYISPPNHIYSLVTVKRDNTTIYVTRFTENLHQQIANEHGDEFFIDPMLIIILIGIGFFVLFVFTLLFVFKKVAQPMESLREWANQLTIDNINQPLPTFRFRELNALATLIHNNFNSLAESVEREKKFLSYASHELRTPIAVLRSNCSLLEKVNAAPSDKERLIRERINRASLTMKSMTETLLWLSRDDADDMPIESVKLGEIVQQSYEELSYLIAGKSIDVTINVEQQERLLAKTPATLVINNLIRNSLQHTQQGSVDISLSDGRLSIINTELISTSEQFTNELGFGLGNQLIQNLIARFNWQFEKEIVDNQYRVIVHFN